jgi:hypothetical protein
MSTRYIGVSNLLDPENCTMILIDHQPLQFAGVQNIDGTLLVNNVRLFRQGSSRLVGLHEL